MQYFTTADEINTYVHECLWTSEGYPDDYDIQSIVDELHRMAGWDHEKQALTETWSDDEFWEIVMNNLK